MFNLRIIVAIWLMIVGIPGSTNFGFDRNDDDLYNQIVIIKGKVQILNHPELGQTAANAMYLVFQRDGCKQCLIATRTDLEGNYEIHVGRGRYRVIVRNPSPPTYDMLAPDQPRYVDTASVQQATQFDIMLVIQPKR